jgi:hypothetical protein
MTTLVERIEEQTFAKIRDPTHSSPRRLAGEKKVPATYNHKTTIWVLDYLNLEFHKILSRAF